MTSDQVDNVSVMHNLDGSKNICLRTGGAGPQSFNIAFMRGASVDSVAELLRHVADSLEMHGRIINQRWRP